jgi:hypothetical protein
MRVVFRSLIGLLLLVLAPLPSPAVGKVIRCVGNTRYVFIQLGDKSAILCIVLITFKLYYDSFGLCRNPSCETHFTKAKCLKAIDQDELGHCESSQSRFFLELQLDFFCRPCRPSPIKPNFYYFPFYGHSFFLHMVGI